MRNLPLLFVLALATICCFSCKDNEDFDGEGKTSMVNVRFRALWNGEPMVLNESLTYNGKRLSVSKLKFFVSDVSLVKDKQEVTIDEIDVVDFSKTNTTVAGADEGVLISKSVITGDYNGLRFGIGVSSDFNLEKPSDFAGGHPLSASGEYWANWRSYVFSKIEGRFDGDTNPNDLEGSYAIHIGKDDYYREVMLNDLGVNVVIEQDAEIVVDLEVSKLFKQADGENLDITTVGNIHGNIEDDTYEILFSNNWQKAFSAE